MYAYLGTWLTGEKGQHMRRRCTIMQYRIHFAELTSPRLEPFVYRQFPFVVHPPISI